MKFVQALLLAGSVSAVKISAAPKHNQLAQMYTQAKSYMSIRQGDGCPTKEQAAQFIDDVFTHLDLDQDGKIHEEEAVAAVDAYCASDEGKEDCKTEEFKEFLDFMGWLAHEADQVLGNKDHVITKKELANVWQHHCGNAKLLAQVRSYMKMRTSDEGCPSRKEAVEFIDEVFAHLDIDENGAITGEEAEAAIKAYCESEEGEKVCKTKEFQEGLGFLMWLGHQADHVHGNKDGAVTKKEVMAVWKHHCGPELAQVFAKAKSLSKQDEDMCPKSEEEANAIADFLLEHLDTNQDGGITEQEAIDAITAWCKSEDSQGYCESEEFQKDIHMLRMLGHEADQVLGNKDAVVTHDEIMNVFHTHCA